MLLKSLELQGFKTFPDKTNLTFERGITSVVGPNGSGKSNISDAMRWVMGEQSIRTLRCSKMEDVVFSGTPQRKAQGFAEVTLTIDNSDRRLDFDKDEVAITRRYYRSGESEYLINKVIVRLKDINELFMDTGLGRDGYSIIGQGKIDSIVGAKSEERREIFEEASGISRFRYRKEEAERRLAKAEDNLVRLRDILTELEERVGPLKIQAEKAEKFIAYDKEKKGLEIGIWLETLERSGKILREHEEKSALARSQHQELEEQLEAIALRIEENFRETNDCTVLMDRQRGEAAGLDEEAVRTEGHISVLMNDISHHTQSVKRLGEQIASAQLSHQDLDRDIAQKGQEIQEKEQAIQESREKLLGFTQRLEELRQGADEATRQIEQSAVALAELNSTLAAQRIALTSAQSSSVEIRLRAGQVDDSVRQNQEQLALSVTEGKELHTLLEGLEAEIQSEENALRGHELRLDSRKKKVESLKAELDRLNLDAGEQLRKARMLEDLERNLEGFAHSVKSVMKEAGRGTLSGICGPVTKLLQTPGDYAVALETALGGALQNIVVETEQDAKNAIRLLKQRDWGRATFLPLTTIRGQVLDAREMQSLPGFIGIASQLCSCEEKFAGIRDSLLGRVAVAQDLDSAVAIAKQTKYRFRVVSLDGQVVNAGGSLTGGSQNRNAGLLGRAAEIEKVKEKAALLQDQVNQAAQEYKLRQAELSSSEGELDAAKGELSNRKQERVRVLSECTRVERDQQQLRLQGESLEKERENSAGRLRELDALCKEAKEKIQVLEAQVLASQEESQRLTGDREEQMARCEDISHTIQEIRLGEFSAQKDKETLLAAVEELQMRKLDSTGVVQRLEEEIAGLEGETQRLDEEILKAQEQAASLRKQAEERRGEITLTAQKRSQLEQEATQLRTREREQIASRENVAREISRLQERSDGLQKEYDTIISRLWEEYELTRREAEEEAQPVEDLQAAQRRLQELKNQIKALGSVNVGAVVEYQEVSQRYEFLNAQVQDVEKSKEELFRLIGDLTRHMREQFVERFGQINANFGSIFRELFGGGAAELSFTDDSDVLSSGIEIKVHPPGKIVTHIESLSGGEKALVAISIYFAIMRVNPPPFCVLDEIEAALDDVNVTRYAQYLRRMSAHSQFITITHRRGTMEGSDVLYGVTMQDQGISKLLTLKTEEAVEVAGA